MPAKMEQTPLPKTVFFDIDGTLMDSLASIKDALNASRRYFGLAPLSDEETRTAVGYGADELIRRTTPEKIQAALLETYLPLLLAQNPRPYAFIPQVLEQLSARGYQLIAASNKPQDVAQACLEKAGIARFFAEIRGVSYTRRPKPSGDLLRLERATPSVLVGDSDVDVDTGLQNSVPVVAVAWGFRTAEQLYSAGARTLCEDPSRLVGMIEKAFY